MASIFTMGKAYLATTSKGEQLFLETITVWYIQYSGKTNKEGELQAKAETLCHYYYRSGKHASGSRYTGMWMWIQPTDTNCLMVET